MYFRRATMKSSTRSSLPDLPNDSMWTSSLAQTGTYRLGSNRTLMATSLWTKPDTPSLWCNAFFRTTLDKRRVRRTCNVSDFPSNLMLVYLKKIVPSPRKKLSRSNASAAFVTSSLLVVSIGSPTPAWKRLSAFAASVAS